MRVESHCTWAITTSFTNHTVDAFGLAIGEAVTATFVAHALALAMSAA